MAKNAIIEGDYKEKIVSYSWGSVSICIDPWSIKNDIQIDKTTVESYEIIDENHKNNVANAVGRSAVGAALLEPIGLLAAASAKNKGTYLIAILFKNGKNSLLEVDEKRKKAIMTKLF